MSLPCQHLGCFASASYVAKDNGAKLAHVCTLCFQELPDAERALYAKVDLVSRYPASLTTMDVVSPYPESLVRKFESMTIEERLTKSSAYGKGSPPSMDLRMEVEGVLIATAKAEIFTALGAYGCLVSVDTLDGRIIALTAVLASVGRHELRELVVKRGDEILATALCYRLFSFTTYANDIAIINQEVADWRAYDPWPSTSGTRGVKP